MRKLDSLFYRKTLLPSLYRAAEAGINITNKSSLLHYYQGKPEKLWVCCASTEDLQDTHEIVSCMQHARDDILMKIGALDSFPEYAVDTVLATVNNDTANNLATAAVKKDRLNTLLWQSKLKIAPPDKAKKQDLIKLAKEAAKYLKQYSEDIDVIRAAIDDFFDQVYFTDFEYRGGKIDLKKVVAKHLYYKNRGDELDNIEIDSDISDKQIDLAKRELTQYLA